MKSQDNSRIVIDSEVLVGKPVIRGTRIAVEHILRLLADGETKQSILAEYPHLTEEDVTAALQYGAETVSHEKVFPIGKFHYA